MSWAIKPVSDFPESFQSKETGFIERMLNHWDSMGSMLSLSRRSEVALYEVAMTFPEMSREYPEVIEFFPTLIEFENFFAPPTVWSVLKSTYEPPPLSALAGIVPAVMLAPLITGGLENFFTPSTVWLLLKSIKYFFT